MQPLDLPLAQKRQADLLTACGFACAPAGVREFSGSAVDMFRPLGERRAALADIIGFGGAAYGGKSYGLLELAAVAAVLWPGVQIAYFRRTYPELTGPGAAAHYAYEVFGEHAYPTDGGMKWQWPTGSAFYFLHCQYEGDVAKYQSQQFDILLIDEATHFTWNIVDYLLTRNRKTVDHPEFKPFTVLVSNPGNVGHAWYASIFDLLEKKLGKHEQVKQTQNPNGKFSSVYFIPAFLEDNAIGVARDPEYERRLMERNAEVARALRKGDWTVFAGQAFPSWMEDRMGCDPFEIPDWWPRWRALDYGFVHPFVAGWFTKNPDLGRVYGYRAVLKSGLTDQQQARLILDMTEAGEKIPFTYASPDMWARKTAGARIFTSVDEYKDEGVILTKADNDRRSGKRKIDRLLVDLPDGKPAIQIFSPYIAIFGCMTTLVMEEHDPEDVKKVDGDDPFDMLKYALTNEKLQHPRLPQNTTNPMNAYFGKSRSRA